MNELKQGQVVQTYTKEEGSLKSRLTNVGTILALASIVVVLLLQVGVIDTIMSETIQVVVYLICGAGVLLGVFNNPKGSGIYLPGVDYPLWGNPPSEAVIDVVGNKIVNTIQQVQAVNVKEESKNIKDKLQKK